MPNHLRLAESVDRSMDMDLHANQADQAFAEWRADQIHERACALLSDGLELAEYMERHDLEATTFVTINGVPRYAVSVAWFLVNATPLEVDQMRAACREAAYKQLIADDGPLARAFDKEIGNAQT